MSLSASSSDMHTPLSQSQLSTALYDGGSFRDRDARIVYLDGRVFRVLNHASAESWKHLAGKPFFTEAMAAGQIVPTWDRGELNLEDGEGTTYCHALEHERLSFVSYPYEWCFGMLKDAALLQLDLITAALEADMSLKDATSYNIQWRGARPQFIDIASFEPYAAGSPWVGYRQFCQLFLNPLFLTAYKNVPFQPWLRSNLDGITATDMAQLFNRFEAFFKKGIMTNVTLMAHFEKLGHQASKSDTQALAIPKAQVLATVSKLRSLVEGLEWSESKSTWGDYDANNTYGDAEREKKEAFVNRHLSTVKSRLTWDLGCNTGRYSKIASQYAEHVLACDFDHLAIERLYQNLKAENKYSNITPLILDLVNPSPNQGWGGVERKAFDQRTKPDAVLMLAAIHHVVITHNVRLSDVMGWLKSLGASVVLEFVNRDDEMTQKLLSAKSISFEDYTLEHFEQLAAEHFEIRDSEWVSDTRKIFCLTPRH